MIELAARARESTDEVPPGHVAEVLPGIWRWAAARPAGGAWTDRCGTALRCEDGLVLVDPPPAAPGEIARLARQVGPVRHVLLTGRHSAPLAEPFRGAGPTVWVPWTGAGGGRGEPPPAGTARYAPGDRLPGGLEALEVPAPAEPADRSAGASSEAALRGALDSGEVFLISGAALQVFGQTPVYQEGEWGSFDEYAAALVALRAAEPDVLLPAYQSDPDTRVVAATGYAAHVGRPIHERRAAPVAGPRLAVPRAARVLDEAALSPVVMRRGRGPAGGDGAAWVPDPFACPNCAGPSEPAVFTCGGPLLPRLCPACRQARRSRPAAYRLMVCGGGCCTRMGSRPVLSELRRAASTPDLAERVDLVAVSCLGECSIGPLVGVAGEHGGEPPPAQEWREGTLLATRSRAAEEGERLDEASERVLARFAAFVDTEQARDLVARLAADRAASA